MNKLQKVARAISGYEPHLPFSSAKDDYYYELENEQEKINHIIDYAIEVYGFNLKKHEAQKIFKFLEESELLSSSDKRWHLFNELKEKRRVI